jgi:TfoX/Sxy family transcriptional regulator of competence genes
MGFSQILAARIRAVLADRTHVVERRMFGGVAFMVGGRMACGVHRDRLIVRIGNEAALKWIGRAHVKPMDFTGKVLKSFATIEPEGIRTAAQLRKWVLMAANYAIQETDETAPRATASQRGSVAGSIAGGARRIPGRGRTRPTEE